MYSRIAQDESHPYLIKHPSGDWFEYVLPVSVKGIVIYDDEVLLVGNDRGELELPGGKLELGERPEDCVVRELSEETGVAVCAGLPVHTWVYEIFPHRHVFVVAYGVDLAEKKGRKPHPNADPEVKIAGWVKLAQLDDVTMPAEYSEAIKRWVRIRNAQ
ncbi:NUDIX domain-containing protein [Flexivirga caeni]|uniref:NUDIX hydrolase n=1 Tax=Flexivirga caeni TaxID=2294115 RepID=A0A3M9M695_9MICO|nr:NUDIX hydrolase [Flexivirga caeni]RNI20727.1 NUDIX hydrolase [Flexivirga caeni]